MDEISKLWNDFAETQKDNITDYTALKSHFIWDELQSKAIVQLSSSTLQDAFKKLVPSFKNYAEKQLNFKNLEFELELVEDPDAKKKTLYTNKDKFDHLAQNNKLLMELVKRLGLELE